MSKVVKIDNCPKESHSSIFLLADFKSIFFEVLRPGTNTTIQDAGRNELFHLGITVSGAIDQKNFKLSNLILNNDIDEAALEFAFQGPLLKIHNGNIGVAKKLIDVASKAGADYVKFQTFDVGHLILQNTKTAIYLNGQHFEVFHIKIFI